MEVLPPHIPDQAGNAQYDCAKTVDAGTDGPREDMFQNGSHLIPQRIIFGRSEAALPILAKTRCQEKFHFVAI
jgi:hypothetical protein